MRYKRIIARILTLAIAVVITAGTTCVTALAAPTIELELNAGSDVDDSLRIMLSAEQRKQLMSAVGDKLADKDGIVYLSLAAKQLDSKSATLPKQVVAAEPVLVGKLMLTWRTEAGKETALASIGTPVQLTIMLPAELDGGSYNVVSFADSSYTAASDLDTVPNTVTLAVTAMDMFVVTRGVVETPKPAVVAPVAPAAPKPTDSNPLAGGVMGSYAPHTVLAQAVPISMPIAHTAPAQSGVSSSMAATSMMMTAAFVSGTIDYENSQQENEQAEEPVGDDNEAVFGEEIFDEDSEDGIEQELEGFREANYR